MVLPSASPVRYHHASMEDALPEGLQLKKTKISAPAELHREVALTLCLFRLSPGVGVWQRGAAEHWTRYLGSGLSGSILQGSSWLPGGAQRLRVAPSPSCEGAAPGGWGAFALLFAGFPRKSAVAMATAGSIHGARRELVAVNQGAGLGSGDCSALLGLWLR